VGREVGRKDEAGMGWRWEVVEGRDDVRRRVGGGGRGGGGCVCHWGGGAVGLAHFLSSAPPRVRMSAVFDMAAGYRPPSPPPQGSKLRHGAAERAPHAPRGVGTSAPSASRFNKNEATAAFSAFGQRMCQLVFHFWLSATARRCGLARCGDGRVSRPCRAERFNAKPRAAVATRGRVARAGGARDEVCLVSGEIPFEPREAGHKIRSGGTRAKGEISRALPSRPITTR